MLVNTVTEFNYGEHVYYRKKDTDPWKEGRIVSIQVTIRNFSMNDIDYAIEPIELINSEHDDEEWVSEHLNLIRKRN